MILDICLLAAKVHLVLLRKPLFALPAPTKKHLFLMLGLTKLEDVMEVFKTYTNDFPVLAFEMFTDVALKYVVKSTGLSAPFETDVPYYVLIELENESDATMEKSHGAI